MIMRKEKREKLLETIFLFGLVFFVGWSAAALQKKQAAEEAGSSAVLEQADNWGLGFGAEGTQPTGTVTADELKKYDAYYVGAPDKKVIYLTFDCGYGNGQMGFYSSNKNALCTDNSKRTEQKSRQSRRLLFRVLHGYALPIVHGNQRVI